MSGHSKWSTIKHKKAAADKKRGALFTRLIRELVGAAKRGGSDASVNPALRTAISRAKAGAMPKDTMERAIKKGAGELEGEQLEDLQLESYGPGGVAMLIDITTDNRNRVVAEVRHILAKYATQTLAKSGAVSWMFSRKGQVLVEGADFEKLFEFAVDAGAEDVQEVNEMYEVTTSPEDFHLVREKIEQAGFKIANAELVHVPSTNVKLEGKPAEQMIRLLGKFEELDDVNNVFANFDMDAAEMERLGNLE